MVTVRWLDVGCGFGPDDDEGDALTFLRHLNVAADLLEASGDGASWRKSSGLSSLDLLCRQGGEAAEPTIELVESRGRRRSYVVLHDWLSRPYLDEGRGPWTLLATLLLTLVTISEEEGISLPSLSSGANA